MNYIEALHRTLMKALNMCMLLYSNKLQNTVGFIQKGISILYKSTYDTITSFNSLLSIGFSVFNCKTLYCTLSCRRLLRQCISIYAHATLTLHPYYSEPHIAAAYV